MSETTLENLVLSSTVNAEDLRDYADNIEDHKTAITILFDYLDIPDIPHQVKTLGQIGTFYRRTTDLKNAELYFSKAIHLAKVNNLDKRLVIVNSIRLAHTLHWAERFKEADTLFNEMINICKNECEHYILLDFVYQHIGKSNFDQAKYTEALKYFNLALELRNKKDDQSLIASTEIAITATEKRMS